MNGTIPPFEKPATGIPRERDSSAESPNVSKNVDGMSETSQCANVADMTGKGLFQKYATVPDGRFEKRDAQESSGTFRKSQKPARHENLERKSSFISPSPKTAIFAVREVMAELKNGNRRSKPFSFTSRQKNAKLRMFGTGYLENRFGFFRYGVEKSGECEKRQRSVCRFVAMEKDVHRSARDESREKRERKPHERKSDEREYRDERKQCGESSFDELLHVPAFGNVVILLLFGFAFVEVFVGVL